LKRASSTSSSSIDPAMISGIRSTTAASWRRISSTLLPDSPASARAERSAASVTARRSGVD